MANMSYCRFYNTLIDLADCYHHLDDDGLSENEKKARIKLYDMCQNIVEEMQAEMNGDLDD